MLNETHYMGTGKKLLIVTAVVFCYSEKLLLCFGGREIPLALLFTEVLRIWGVQLEIRH